MNEKRLIMASFYISDPKILFNSDISDTDYRIYSYCCSQYNVQKLTSFIRVVSIASHLKISIDLVKDTLDRLASKKVDGLPLISVQDNGKFLVFDMPYHKQFVMGLGFERFNSSKGWSNLRKHTQRTVDIKYKYPQLDQYQLEEKLRDLPIEELNQITDREVKYPWVLNNVKKSR